MIRDVLKRDPRLLQLWARLRASRQETLIRNDLESYRRAAATKNIPLELGKSEIVECLRRKLMSRGLHTRKNGQLHIVYATPLGNWERHNIPPALQRFGAVTPFYLAEQGFNDQSAEWVQERRKLDKALVQFIEHVHGRTRIDVIVCYLSGRHVTPETIRAINRLGIATCAFWWDDRLSFRGSKLGGRYTGAVELAPAYDINLTNSSDSIVKYLVEGGLAMFWPEGANPGHFRLLDRPFKYDVTFVGACYGQRPLFIEFLRRRGVHVEAFGPGWPNGPLTASEVVEVYNASRINLGFSGIGYSMKECCLKGRDFEVPMCGALYLTTEQPDLHKVYEIDREVVTYRTKEGCLDSIRDLLSNPERCRRIRQAARERSLRDHTWERRFQELFETMGFLEDGSSSH